MNLSFTIASPGDALEILLLRNKVAQHLMFLYGEGHWSLETTEKGIINGMTDHSKVLIAKQDDMIAGTLRLATKKPWAIDPNYFTPVRQPLYLTDMAVHPDWQRKGIGKYMLQEVRPFVTSWPAQAIRLDAYNSAAGAGDFYRKCGLVEMGRIVYRKIPLIYFELLIENS
jgi:GNAT superfamily N-acetyltransferase